ncbi:hypothetical protein SAMN06298224_2503 [Fibrobacter sp. UWB16]|nr:hypothetical protein SAMN06298224_2503 [Fibrobacter sp. UWB16]
MSLSNTLFLACYIGFYYNKTCMVMPSRNGVRDDKVAGMTKWLAGMT